MIADQIRENLGHFDIQDQLFGVPAQSVETYSHKVILSQQEIATFLIKLMDLLKNEPLYLDASLSLKILADQIDLHPNKLSWLLNEQIRQNFNEYINTFRLATFKEKALDANNSHLTLLGLAYESGFNSKTAFNTFFKKSEGMTPRAWVKSNQKLLSNTTKKETYE